MVDVVRCESQFHQFRSNGKPLISSRNKDGTYDIGLLEINSRWLPLSKKMGLDIVNNAEDNIKFGQYLLKKYGISQWSCA